MIDQPSEDAVEAAAWVLAGADQHADIGTAWIDCARRVLTSAYPLLRQQIETEVRRQVEAEIEQMESAWYFGGPHAPGVRVVSLEGALLAARGAAQPGGER